jgi:hypothetical protein
LIGLEKPQDGAYAPAARRRGRRGVMAAEVMTVKVMVAMVCLLVAGALSGCSTSDTFATVMIDPAHYSVYHCDGLVPRLKALQKREQDLSDLMARASEGGGGVLIGNLTYRADYENVVAEEKVLRRAAADKNCDLNPPPPPASPTPTAFTAPPPGRTGAPVFPSNQSTR